MKNRRSLRPRRRTGKAIIALSLLGAFSQVELGPPSAKATEPIAIDAMRELMIVHPAVVDPFLNGGRSHNGGPAEAAGPWSMRYMLESLPAPSAPTLRNLFYASFFEQWLTTQTADNGELVPPRDPALVRGLMLDQFSTLDAAGARTFQLWRLPFELIAIVYRPDLRAADGSDAGELRFVYKLVSPSGEDQQLTINFEFKIKTTIHSAITWAHNFNRLGVLEIGSEEYLSLLQGLTRRILRPLDPPARLGQVRTNELAFNPSTVWEMREFVVQGSGPSMSFRASSVENTPREALNGTQTLSDFIAANPGLSQPGTGFMSFKLPDPLDLASGPVTFLGGASHAGVHWSVPQGSTVDPQALDNLGLLTCNGCHQDNKSPGDMPFYHIKPDVSPGQNGVARLSLFLTTPDPDPLRAVSRPGELNRRKQDFAQLLAQPWTAFWMLP